MPPATSLSPEMVDLLGRGGSILTGNQRAARTLRLGFDRHSRLSGLATWQPPAVYAWDTWTASLYHQLLLDGHATRVLLNRSQEFHLWRSIISADPQWKSLQPTDSLAELAASAWQLLCAYRGRTRLRTLGVSDDTRSFQRWAQTFLRRCQSDTLLSAAELEETLAAAITAGKLLRPATEVLLVGFDLQTPAQRLLTTTLRDSGTPVSTDPSVPTPPLSSFATGGGSASLHETQSSEAGAPPIAASSDGWANELHIAAAEDPAAELRQAALWLRSFLLENPDTRAAVIVPDLAAERREIDRVFRQTLAPELQNVALENITARTGTGPYEFSLGQPLAATPIAATALEILRLADGPVPIAAVSHLLLSPYFTIEPAERNARAEFDAFELRKSRSLRPEITLDQLIARLTALASGSKRAGLAALLSQLRSLQRTAAKPLPDRTNQKSFSAWADHFRELLESSGWALLSRLDSTEFQARQKWESALDELATLDLLAPRCDYTEALAALEGILQRTLFAPASREAPIQIMSPLEAAGSRFDALWFLRASDLDWPVRPGIHPFLGWRLQHELAMPGSDPALDTLHARRITARLAASAGTVIFSYARQTADGHQRPSPLLAAFNPAPMSAPAEELPRPAIPLEVFEESAFIPLENLTVRGGAEILKQQSACAFRAFAEKRLHSTPLEAPVPGMDARESGNVVHKALEHFWTDVRSQSALRNLTADERAAQLSSSIEYSLRRARTLLASDPSATLWDDAYLDLQRRRLHRLLAPWLELELNRAPFEVVLREKDETATIGPLTLDLRVDRVDRLLDPPGGEVVIDYKTGDYKTSAWATERPDEPQLPFYAVLRQPSPASVSTPDPASMPVAAVAFAVIRAGKEMALRGHESRADLLSPGKPGKIPSGTLDLQIEEWRQHLTALAQAFADGDARVRPKDYPKTCRYCAQRLLCRLDPTNLVVDDPDEEALEEDYA